MSVGESIGSSSPYLEFVRISKSFPGVLALDDVSFGVNSGSVRALVGENGAGKSTLLKILSGVYRPSSGVLRIDGSERAFQGTSESLAAGVSVIYQELVTVPKLSVAENLFLGHLPKKRGLVDYPCLYELARAALVSLADDIDPRTPLGLLSIGQQQMMEIAKALTRGARILAFDEPTSSLSAREIERLFSVIERLRSEGRTILYVSHRMEEIFQICDSVTVFKDGRHIETFHSTKGLTQDILINRMVGRDIKNVYNYSERPYGDVSIEARDITGPGLKEPISIRVRSGEILGLFGLVGAGRTELLKLIYGATRRTGGEILLKGHPAKVETPRDAIDQGIVFCSENRKAEGIIPLGSVQENINISARRHHGYRMGFINETWERRNAKEQVRSLDVRTPSLEQRICNLSGGNQQKVILARWLSDQMSVVLFDEPTRGIDVGARSEIYALIRRLAERGVAILMVSSDLPEVLGVSDRIAVMRDGALSGIVERTDTSEQKILSMALPV
ncbi:L-arabinose ABC transporter ATP-binding protein AraG [Telmatospirillum siberiense]|uniref:L-arabinose ABC transporter ATP-binding protein AraG n=1 Tax=Telmatospirillum siberiense TaxID=382514 RepID=UPI001F531961|nr:L-arabinose ABC transporter ATP-binding protein AraG [Telmatospirillum siberiense]